MRGVKLQVSLKADEVRMSRGVEEMVVVGVEVEVVVDVEVGVGLGEAARALALRL